MDVRVRCGGERWRLSPGEGRAERSTFSPRRGERRAGAARFARGQQLFGEEGKWPGGERKAPDELGALRVEGRLSCRSLLQVVVRIFERRFEVGGKSLRRPCDTLVRHEDGVNNMSDAV